MKIRTRDASIKLGVSQKTLRRWISHFPNVFPKDPSGRYLFTEKEMGLLDKIKKDVRGGVPLDRTELPVQPEPVLEGAHVDALDMLLLRVDQLERSVAHKADEVVSAQIFQHRLEIEELRQMIRQLAEAIEGMQQTAVGHENDVHKEVTSETAFVPRSNGKAAAREQRKRGFWLF